MNRWQVEEWNLPTRPTKKSDTRSKGFDGDSVELDAIPAPKLRQLVEDAITSHLDQREVDVMLTIEAEQRDGILELRGLAA